MDLFKLKSGLSGVDLYNAVRNSKDDFFKSRLPEGREDNVREVKAAIDEFPELGNDLYKTIANMIVEPIINSRIWENPLAKFKNELPLGGIVEEIASDLVQAEYLDAREDNDPQKKNYPDIKTQFHTMGKPVTYTATYSQLRMSTAFNSWDSLSRFADMIVTTLNKQYNVDDYAKMRKVIFDICENKQGLMVPCPDVVNGGPEAATALVRLIKENKDNLTFPSTKYNTSGFPTETPIEEQVLIMTPAVKAAIEVGVLAEAYHLPYVDPDVLIQTVDQLPYGVMCVQMDRNKMRCWHQKTSVTTYNNPKDLSTSFFHNSRDIYSYQDFKNAIVYFKPAGLKTFKINPTEASVTGTSGGSVNFTTTVEYTEGIVYKDVVPEYSVTPVKEGVTIDKDSGILTFTAAAATTGETYTVKATPTVDGAPLSDQTVSEATVTVK